MGIIEAIKSLIEFLADENNYKLITENFPTFLLFGIIILIIAISGFAIFCKIKYKGFSEYKRLKDDYEELEKKYKNEKEKNIILNDQIRNLTTEHRMLEHIHNNSSPEIIGQEIASSL